MLAAKSRDSYRVVVFLIGLRVNRWWKFWQWLCAAMAMPRMLKELKTHPELGMLGADGWFGRTTNGDVGIWHETYRGPAGNFESVYLNMPAFGLAKATSLEEARGHRAGAAGRLAGKPVPVS